MKKSAHAKVTVDDVVDKAWKLHVAHKLSARVLAKRFGVNESQMCARFRERKKIAGA